MKREVLILKMLISRNRDANGLDLGPNHGGSGPRSMFIDPALDPTWSFYVVARSAINLKAIYPILNPHREKDVECIGMIE